MVLPNNSIRKQSFCVPCIQGFTLLEVLIVLALITGGMTIGAFVSFDGYYQAGRITEAETLRLALMTARTRSLEGKYGLPAGVAVQPNEASHYVVFSGDSYATRISEYDSIFPSLYPVGIASSSPHEVVFSSLRATTTPVTVQLLDVRGREVHINITYEGFID